MFKLFFKKLLSYFTLKKIKKILKVKIFKNNNKSNYNTNTNKKYKFKINNNIVNNFNYKIFNAIFLRNYKIFLKSRISKMRVFSKTIVYLSLLQNIIVINELHSVYYNISINYGYSLILNFILVIYFLFLIIKR